MAARADWGDPAVETVWSLNEAAVEAWLAGARPGDVLPYARGPVLPRHSSGVAALQRHHDAGLVTFKQKRNGDGDYSYLAERCSEAQRPAPHQRLIRPVPTEDCDELALLMAALRRLVVRKEPCPTNRALGVSIGVESPDRVAYLLRKLISAGRIRIDAVTRERRVVTISATGRQTAVPA